MHPKEGNFQTEDQLPAWAQLPGCLQCEGWGALGWEECISPRPSPTERTLTLQGMGHSCQRETLPWDAPLKKKNLDRNVPDSPGQLQDRGSFLQKRQPYWELRTAPGPRPRFTKRGDASGGVTGGKGQGRTLSTAQGMLRQEFCRQ